VLDDGQPKYLNSPETRVFRKSEALYGIHRAKSEIRSRGLAVVVEGYMDVIPVHVAGISNAVASLGTAFTREQARRVTRYAPEAVLIYDGDQAGRLASLRACVSAAEAGLRLRIGRLPPEHDPDSFLRQHGVEALNGLISEAPYYLDFIIGDAPSGDLEEVIKFALGVVARVEDPIRSSLDLRRLSELSGIAEFALTRSLERARSGKGSEVETPADTSPCDKLEKSIVSILVGLPEYAERVLETVKPADFTDPRMRLITETVLDRRSRNLAADAGALVSAVEDEPTRKLLIECSVGEELAGDAERIVEDHIVCMRRRIITRRIADLRRQIQTAEGQGDRERLKDLLSKRQDLAQDLRQLST
jgi:DNA primase